MEFKLNSYRRQYGNIFTTPDGHIYFTSKIREGRAYLKCVLYRNGCKATAKLHLITNLIIPGAKYNHSIQEYLSDVFELESKCRDLARKDSLVQIFDDVTREDIAAFDVKVNECKSWMYRSRRMLQPKISATPAEFSQMLPYTIFGAVSSNNHMAVVFFSDNIGTFLLQTIAIQFAGTFYTIPIQFYQLWTVFLTVNTHL